MSLPKPPLTELEKIVGHHFQKQDVLRQALTHRSASSTHNERLEFLGDSILDSFITEYLYHQLPTKDEGVLTDMRSKMVSRRTLNKLAKEFKIETFER